MPLSCARFGRALWLLVLALLLAFVAISPYAFAQNDNSSEARTLTAAGIEAYDRGDYRTAIDDLKNAQALSPSYSPTELYLGLAYLKEDRSSDAIAAWQKYVSLRPGTETEKRNDLTATITQYLTILLREQDREQAEKAIAQERRIGPGDPDTVAITYYHNLGSPRLLYLQKGLTALIIDDVSKVPGIKVVERDKLQALLDEMNLGSSGLVDPRTAARAGHLLGAGQVATGSYLDPTKGNLHITSILADTGSARRKPQPPADGREVEFYVVEKTIAKAILNDLNHNEKQLQAEGVLAQVEKPQTKNHSAFEAFSRGLDSKDRGNYAQARSQFQEALKDDPDFELARRELYHTPLAPLTTAEIEGQVAASAPSAAEAGTTAVAGIDTIISAPPPPPLIVPVSPPPPTLPNVVPPAPPPG